MGLLCVPALPDAAAPSSDAGPDAAIVVPEPIPDDGLDAGEPLGDAGALDAGFVPGTPCVIDVHRQFEPVCQGDVLIQCGSTPVGPALIATDCAAYPGAACYERGENSYGHAHCFGNDLVYTRCPGAFEPNRCFDEHTLLRCTGQWTPFRCDPGKVCGSVPGGTQPYCIEEGAD